MKKWRYEKAAARCKHPEWAKVIDFIGHGETFVRGRGKSILARRCETGQRQPISFETVMLLVPKFAKMGIQERSGIADGAGYGC